MSEHGDQHAVPDERDGRMPSAAVSPLEHVFDELERAGMRPRRMGGGWQARCPAHEDTHPSLSLSEGEDGRALVHCFAGCTVEAVVAALDLTVRDLFPRQGEG